MKARHIAFAVSALALVSGSVMAGSSSSSSGVFNVVTAASISAGDPLKFPNIIMPASGSVSVAVDTGGGATYSPTSAAPGTTLGISQAGTFTVTGDPGFKVKVTYTPTASAGLTLALTATTATDPLTTGTATFTYGGTLTVASTYTGSGTISVDASVIYE